MNIRKKIWEKDKSNILAIDLLDKTIRFLELTNKENMLCVNAWGKEEVATTIEDTLLKLKTQLNAKTKHIAIALPHSSILNKTVQVKNNLSDLEVEKFCYFVAEKHFGIKTQNINLDFQRLPNADPQNNYLQVELIATRKEKIEELTQIFKTAKLTLKIVDVDCFALERAAKFCNADQTNLIAIANVGKQSLLIQIVDAVKTIYAHEYSISSGIRDQKSQLAQQILNAIELGSSSINKQIERIMLSGEAKTCNELQRYFSEETHFISSLFDPFLNIKNCDAKLRQFSSEFALCFGLCLRQFANGDG